MKFYPSSVSFASGELSPVLSARVDLSAYSIGARELTNFIVLPQGGLINRPGTRVLSQGSGLYSARLIPFIFNAITSYCIVYETGGHIHVYNNDGTFAGNFIGFQYNEQELQEIRWLQSADVIYIFHANRQTHKIMRHSDTNWSMEPVVFENGPYQDMNTDRADHLFTGNLADVNMRITTDDSGNHFLHSDVPYFTAEHIGLLFRLEFTVKAASGHITLRYSPPNEPTFSEEFMMYGPSTITTTGTWTGRVTVWRKFPTDTDFVQVHSKSSNDDANMGYQEDVQFYGTKYKLSLTRDDGSGYVTVNAEWSSSGGLIARQVRITGFIDDQTMSVTPLDDVITDTGDSRDWAFGAFGGVLGYPSIGIFHQERLVLANSKSQRQTVWMSRSASWEDFGTEIPTVDTDAITITIASKQIDDIVGLSSRSDLLIFTIGGEWVAKAGKNNDVFTPSSVIITPSSYHGSYNIQPLEVSSYVLFAQRHGKVVRGMGYQFDIDGYNSNELSVLSSHLFDDTMIRDWAYQQEPWSVVWIALDSGVVLALTIQEEHKVTAWARCTFRTPIRDVMCIPGNGQDELFMLGWNEDQPGSSKLMMLNHRNDDSTFSPSSYLDEASYPYESVFESMELEQNVNGSLQGRFKHVPEAAIRVYKAYGFSAGIMTENNKSIDRIRFPGGLSPETRTVPFTGDVLVTLPGGAGRESRVKVVNSEPHPLTLLGVYMTVEINDKG